MRIPHVFAPIRTRLQRWQARPTDTNPPAENCQSVSTAESPSTLYQAEGVGAVEPGLTPNEQFLELLAEHGGRMRQADMVAEMDFSKSTVSRRLSALEQDGQIKRIEAGRSKIVVFPDDDT